GIDPTLPLSVYIRKQENCQDFAKDARVPISEQTMVTTGTKHALQSGDFTAAWKEWIRHEDAHKTWTNWKNHWTQAFNENRAIQRLTGNIFRANATIEDELSEKMVASLDNLANAAVQKNDTIDKLIDINKQQQATIHNLQVQNGELLTLLKRLSESSTTRPNTNIGKDINGYCWTHGFKVKKGHTSKTCTQRAEGHQEKATRRNTMGGSEANKVDIVADKANKSRLLCSATVSSGCENPSNLSSTALLDTAANISLLTDGAPAEKISQQYTPKSVMQPKGDRLHTTENLLLLLNKLPLIAREAHRAPGITNNLMSAATLADAGCEIFFHKTGCEVSLNGEVILRGWRDPTTRLWRVSLHPDGGNTIVPTDQHIIHQLLIHTSPEINNIYECENTGQLINFYYATLGYPVISTWIKAIDKGYFRGWRGLTSDRLITAYNDVYRYLRIRGYRPKLHRLDNETSQDVENFISEQNAVHQYTPPDIHRTNIAERMIRTWKNHMCAIRAGTPKTYRLSNWCKDLTTCAPYEQAHPKLTASLTGARILSKLTSH
ncbi:hypothetical protein ACHAW6_007122, partial [Cyclotella cf. meneghiniana]